LWIDWVTPWKTGDRPDDWSQDPSQWQIFVADNFPFYSTLFDAILQKFHGRLSFNDLLISLSRRELEASAPRPSPIAIEDLRVKL
jgi:hypothetical protein